MTFAVLPAAGKSTRMGRPKLSLPLGDRTVIEWVVAALRDTGIEHIVVVIGPHVPDLVPLAEKAGADPLLLREETPDMRATVEAGLRWLEERFHPSPDDDWLLVPADHPTMDAEVVRQLLWARAAHPGKSIAVPTHEGRRGHPTLIAWKHVAGIQAFPLEQGLNSYLRQHASDTLEVPVASGEILLDVDTPADYARALGPSDGTGSRAKNG
jgi:molybdenum cofactor cytidylyltransferase